MGDEQLTFVCWKWDSSKHPHPRKKRRAFTSAHVNILYAMLYRNVSIPFRLLCVTDDPVDIRPEVTIIPIWKELRDLGGCFLRLVAFKKDFDLFGDKFISIDLDCVILKDITSLFTRDEDFVIWHPRKAVRWLQNGVKGKYYCGSLWMLKAGTRSVVYDTFNPENVFLGFDGRYEGGTDQKHISKILYPNEACWTDDDGIFTFVDDLARPKGNYVAKNPRIVFFNGRFMPDDLECRRFSWVRENYNDSLEKVVQEPEKTPEKVPEVQPVPEPRVEILEFPKLDKSGKINIITFYWDNWPDGAKRELGILYIKHLFEGVRKFMLREQKHEFILFTDDLSIKEQLPDDISVRLLDVPKNLKWNLKKFFMYGRNSGLDAPTLCLDLDTLVVGDLSSLIRKVNKLVGEAANKIICCEDAYMLGRAGGSVVAFIPSVNLEKLLWTPILTDYKKIEKLTGGSERFYYRYKHKTRALLIDFWEKIIPGYVWSYKRDCRRVDKKPEKLSVIRFHGKPRPHQVTGGWVKEILEHGQQ